MTLTQASYQQHALLGRIFSLSSKADNNQINDTFDKAQTHISSRKLKFSACGHLIGKNASISFNATDFVHYSRR